MRKQGFTLLELLLVVVIVGLVYGFAVNGLKRYSEKTTELNLMTLPDLLDEHYDQNHVAVICTDRCKKCELYVDGKVVKEVEPFLDNKAEFYRFDPQLDTQELVWTPIYDEDGREKRVCFRYELFPDGSSSEMMVKYRKVVIDYLGFFGGVKRYASLEEAVDAKQELIRKVLE